MKISKILTAAFAIFALIATVNTAYAQTVQATGTVLEPISFTSTSNLDFGTSIFPGINEQVKTDATTAAEFAIDGEPGKEITADFTLPTVLDHDTDAATMEITFSTTDGEYDIDGTADATTNLFDPNSQMQTTLATDTDATPGQLYIWLGGTVKPTSSQTKGAYSADITIDVAYTGS